MELKDFINQTKGLSFNDFLSKTFITMTIGLLISLISAFFAFHSLDYLYRGSFMILLLQVGIAWFFSWRLMTMTKATAWFCFIAYSALTGVTLGVLPFVYGGGVIFFALISTIILFISMAIIGYTSKLDLTSYGSYFMIGLFAIIIITIINIFLRLEFIDILLAYAGVLLFLGLTAYDVQVLRRMYTQSTYDDELAEKLIIFGAFQLYLDFINLFIRLVQIFGRRND